MLLCADFGYGYPAGFASLLAKSVPASAALAHRLAVPQRARAGRHRKQARPATDEPQQSLRGRERHQRLSIESGLTRSILVSFQGRRLCLRSAEKAAAAVRLLDRDCRIASHNGHKSEERYSVSSLWHGQVGSQVLTGIPRLESIRLDPQFARCSAVWPFETGWAPSDGTWLDPKVRIVHAEIYPSVRAPLTDTIKDRGQVRAMWHWARDLDAKNLLIGEFAIPPGIASGSAEDQTIRREEGWILGCPG